MSFAYISPIKKKFGIKKPPSIVEIPEEEQPSILHEGEVEYDEDRLENELEFLKIDQAATEIQLGKLMKQKPCDILKFGRLRLKLWLIKKGYLLFQNSKNTVIKSALYLDVLKNNAVVYNIHNEKGYITHYFNTKKKRIRFIIIPILLIFHDGSGNHSNVLIIDHVKKQVILFEPHGGTKNLEDQYYDHVIRFFKTTFQEIEMKYRFLQQKEICLREKIGDVDIYEGPQQGDPYCVFHTFLFVYLRLLNPDLKPRTIIAFMSRNSFILINLFICYVHAFEAKHNKS